MSDTNDSAAAENEIATDIARSKFNRHKDKLKLAALAGLAGASFYLGRKSKNVDVDVSYSPDESDNQD
jgi:hypothetical protein